MRLLAILLVGALAITVGLWMLFDQFILVWFAVLGNLIKSSLFLWIIAMIRRWFMIELPKLILFFLLRIGVPIRIRAKVQFVIKASKLWLIRTKEAVVTRAQTVLGKRTALALAIIATLVVSVLAFILAGAYIVWIIGPVQIFSALKWILAPTFRLLQNFLFKVIANTGLLRLWNWLKNLIPLALRRSLLSFWSRAIRQRQRFVRFAVRSVKRKPKAKELL